MKDNMDSQDKLLLILDKISESNERQARIETKMEGLKEEIEEIKVQDEKQNQLLAEHIAGTVANTERLNLEIKNRQDLESRVERLEKPGKFAKAIHGAIMWFGAPVGVIIGIVYEAGRILHKW